MCVVCSEGLCVVGSEGLCVCVCEYVVCVCVW